MKTAFYQFNPAFGKKEENIQKVVSALKEADMDLLVLPEFFATGYQFISHEEVSALSESIPEGNTTKMLDELSRERGIYIVAGLPERHGDTFYNSAVLTGPDGYIGTYRKIHLYSEEKLYFSPGDTGFRVWDTKTGKIGIMICFDWFFPESMRTLSVMGAEIIAHPSNLVLPYCPDAMPTRCLENGVFAVTANRTGVEKRKKNEALTFIGQSEIVSPKGEIIVRALKDEETMMIAEIDPKSARNKTLNPFNDIFKDRRTEKYR
jgi:predicted amidohydrolase